MIHSFSLILRTCCRRCVMWVTVLSQRWILSYHTVSPRPVLLLLLHSGCSCPNTGHILACVVPTHAVIHTKTHTHTHTRTHPVKQCLCISNCPSFFVLNFCLWLSSSTWTTWIVSFVLQGIKWKQGPQWRAPGLQGLRLSCQLTSKLHLFPRIPSSGENGEELGTV